MYSSGLPTVYYAGVTVTSWHRSPSEYKTPIHPSNQPLPLSSNLPDTHTYTHTHTWKHRYKYIEEKMADRRKLNSEFKPGEAPGVAASTAISKEEADAKLTSELFRLPDNLKVTAFAWLLFFLFWFCL